MHDYDNILAVLKPKCEARASAGLRSKLKRGVSGRRLLYRELILGFGAMGVAAALLVAVLLPDELSAKEVLENAIANLRGSSSVRLEVEIRSRPMENFAFISLGEPFVSHTITATGTDSTLRWRVDKRGRIACGTADDSFTWIPGLNIGWHIEDSPDAVLNFIAILLSPNKIIESELEQALANDGTEYKIARSGNEMSLTVHAMPQGDFSNPYMLNSSVDASENIRRYIFDAKTFALKSASVSVINRGHETEVLRIVDVRFNVAVDDICGLPPTITFKEDPQSKPVLAGIDGIPPKEVAREFLNALYSWDKKVIGKVIDADMGEVFYKDRFYRSRLINVGEPFRSGRDDSGVFVPYVLRLRNGNEQCHNLHLVQQRDSSWIVSGGL